MGTWEHYGYNDGMCVVARLPCSLGGASTTDFGFAYVRVRAPASLKSKHALVVYSVLQHGELSRQQQQCDCEACACVRGQGEKWGS